MSDTVSKLKNPPASKDVVEHMREWLYAAELVCGPAPLELREIDRAPDGALVLRLKTRTKD